MFVANHTNKSNYCMHRATSSDTSYVLLHTQMRSMVNASANTTIQLPSLCKQLSIMGYIPLQGDICNFAFSFTGLLTVGLRLYPQNQVLNCQQQALLKSHLSKIPSAYSSKDNHFQKSGRWAQLEHSRYASSGGNCNS